MKSITSDQEHVGKCGLFPSSLRDKCNVLLEILSPYFFKRTICNDRDTIIYYLSCNSEHNDGTLYI